VQETRLYDSERDETRSMRSKEDAHDYRYFPDPDLPPLIIAPDWVQRVQQAMPELPASKRARFEADLGLSGYDARSEEHTSELQSLMRNSYAVFCLKKKQ